jgi:hypothetical protein
MREEQSWLLENSERQGQLADRFEEESREVRWSRAR